MRSLMRRWAPLVVLLLVGCHPLYGFVESEFQLSSDSPLPKWVVLSKGVDRSDVSMTFTFYTFGKVKMVVSLNHEKTKLSETVGSMRWHPTTEKQGFSARPSYLYISVDGKEELFVNKIHGPVLSVATDGTH